MALGQAAAEIVLQQLRQRGRANNGFRSSTRRGHRRNADGQQIDLIKRLELEGPHDPTVVVNTPLSSAVLPAPARGKALWKLVFWLDPATGVPA